MSQQRIRPLVVLFEPLPKLLQLQQMHTPQRDLSFWLHKRPLQRRVEFVAVDADSFQAASAVVQDVVGAVGLAVRVVDPPHRDGETKREERGILPAADDAENWLEEELQKDGHWHLAGAGTAGSVAVVVVVRLLPDWKLPAGEPSQPTLAVLPLEHLSRFFLPHPTPRL